MINDKNMENKKVLILGFSKTGIKAAEYFLNHKAQVYISDSAELNPKDNISAKELEKMGAHFEFSGHSEEFIKGSAFCILSPSIPTDAPILAKLEELNIPYFSDIEYVSKFYNDNMILVTGTNGKTTTTALISHLLSQKFQAPATGNIGISPIYYMDNNPDYFVVEGSSFQLNYSPTLAPHIAVFCNLTPDHILWHKTIENYFEAKAKPFYNQKETDNAILNYDDNWTKNLAQKIKSKVFYFSLNEIQEPNCAYFKNNKIYFKQDNKIDEIIDIKDLQIVGPHNVQNVMCAVIAAKIVNLDNETIKEGLKSFRAIDHRLQYIRTIEGTDYYNDSKATNPEASIVAINSFENKKVVLIAGGRDKKTSLKDFIQAVKERISKVILIGEATMRFRQELSKEDYINIVTSKTLEEAIDIASLDKPDIVLLSPACASFDMFESYEKRGEAFKNYVLSKK